MAGNGSAQGLDQHTGGLESGLPLTGGQSHEVIGLQPQGLHDLLLDGVDKLGNAAHQLAVFVHAEPIGLAAGHSFHICQRLVDKLPGLVELTDLHGLHQIALGKGLEAAAAQNGGDILHPQVDPQVRLVGAVVLHGLVVGDAGEGGAAGPVIGAVLGKNRGQHVLQNGKHVLLGGEGHLHIQLIELAGGAVRAGVHVTEAGGDLEVAVEARGHQQLLELLGSLRQRVELAGMVPGGHQIVTGALGGGGRQNGCGDLQEAVLGHGLPQGGHHVAPQNDVLLHSGVPQIQIAVLQPLGLVGLPAAVDLEGQFAVLAAAQHLHLGGNNLNLAGGHLVGLAVALPDGALHGNGGLFGDGLEGVHHVLGLRHHLGGAVEVADHHEGQIGADHADVLHPAGNFHLLARVTEAQLSTGMSSILHHIVASFP